MRRGPSIEDAWLRPDPSSPHFRVEIEGEGGAIRREIALTRDFEAAVAVFDAMRRKWPGYEVILRQRARIMRRASEWPE